MTTVDIALYSIGVRGVRTLEMLALLKGAGITRLHLRTGPRGEDVLRWPASDLATLAQELDDRDIQIDLMTADVDLQELSKIGAPQWATLRQALQIAEELNCPRVRVHVKSPPTPVLPSFSLPRGCVIEFDHVGWFTSIGQAAASRVLDVTSAEMLLDTLAFSRGSVDGTLRRDLVERVAVLHLHDHGAGALAQSVEPLVSRLVRRGVNLGFEWTGDDRSWGTCLCRYHHARAAVSKAVRAPSPSRRPIRQ